ncbi:MAG: PRC-barrel domain-containing protein [Thermomicrobiales bacterium]
MTSHQTLTKFTPMSHQDYDILTGLEVFSRDGKKIGKVKSVFHPQEDFQASVGRHYFLLEPGKLKDWFGGLDETYLPESAIAGISAEGLVLNLSEEQIKAQNWEKPAVVDSYRTG